MELFYIFYSMIEVVSQYPYLSFILFVAVLLVLYPSSRRYYENIESAREERLEKSGLKSCPEIPAKFRAAKSKLLSSGFSIRRLKPFFFDIHAGISHGYDIAVFRIAFFGDQHGGRSAVFLTGKGYSLPVFLVKPREKFLLFFRLDKGESKFFNYSNFSAKYAFHANKQEVLPQLQDSLRSTFRRNPDLMIESNGESLLILGKSIGDDPEGIFSSIDKAVDIYHLLKKPQKPEHI